MTAEAVVTVNLDDNVEAITDLISYRLDSDFTIPSDSWEFTVYDGENPAGLRRKFYPWRTVSLNVDGRTQVLGRIFETSGGGSSELTVRGRDYIADLADPNVNPKLKLKKEESIAAAMLRIFEPFGVNTITSDGFATARNILTGKTPASAAPEDLGSVKIDEFKAQYGQGCFEMANAIAARHGYTIQPAGDRTKLALARPDYDQPVTYTLSRGSEGNILSGSASRDWSRVPTLVKVMGQGHHSSRGASRAEHRLPAIGDTAPNKLSESSEVQRMLRSLHLDFFEHKEGEGAKSGIYRPIFFEDKAAKNLAQVERAARRMLAERLRPTLQYQCTMRGHTDPRTGATYAVDTMAHVEDAIEDVSEPMWIQARTFRNDGTSGPLTDLTLIRPGTWVL